MHLLFLLLAALLTAAVPLATFDVDLSDLDLSFNETSTHSFVKRGCTYKTEGAKWECDDEIPKISEIIDRLRNQAAGRARPANRAVFYSNLEGEFFLPGTLPPLTAVDPNIGPDKNNEAAWLVGWMDTAGFKDKYYWWANCINRYWLAAQARHIRDNQEKNKAKCLQST